MRSTRSIIVALVGLAGCDAGIYCGVDLVYDRVNQVCACPPDRVWDPDAGTCFAADGGCIEREFYRDEDLDGHGDSAETLSACDAPVGFVSDSNDCDDSASSVNPGAPETCNERDDDCDGDIDEGLVRTYYRDADGDRYGDAADSVVACDTPDGYVDDATDCDDARSEAHPTGIELCNLLDDDCDQDGGAELGEDADGDGHAAVDAECVSGPAGTLPKDDCRDDIAAVHPGLMTFRPEGACAPGLQPCHGSFSSRPGAPTVMRWMCIPETEVCPTTRVSLLPPEPTWDYNCDGDEEPVAPTTACTYDDRTIMCSGTGFRFAAADAPECGSATPFARCGLAGMGCSTTLADEPLPCR